MKIKFNYNSKLVNFKLTGIQRNSKNLSPKFLKKSTKNDLLYDGNFHEAVGPGKSFWKEKYKFY